MKATPATIAAAIAIVAAAECARKGRGAKRGGVLVFM
jgi:hypothetical protein